MAAPNSESKASEEKADGTPEQNLSPAKSVAKKRGKPGEPDADEPKSAQDIFVENLPTIVVIALIFIAVPLIWTYQSTETRTQSERAWIELQELKSEVREGDEGFEALARRHKGSTADPYIRMTWASRLYESGEQAKVQQARDIYQKVFEECGAEIELIRNVLPQQIKKIEAELQNPSTPWRPPGGRPPVIGDDPPPSGDSGSFPPIAPGGEGGEEPGHEGHDHGSEGEEDAPPADAPPAESGGD